jgi:hypothetical protein
MHAVAHTNVSRTTNVILIMIVIFSNGNTTVGTDAFNINVSSENKNDNIIKAHKSAKLALIFPIYPY